MLERDVAMDDVSSCQSVRPYVCLSDHIMLQQLKYGKIRKLYNVISNLLVIKDFTLLTIPTFLATLLVICWILCSSHRRYLSIIYA